MDAVGGQAAVDGTLAGGSGAQLVHRLGGQVTARTVAVAAADDLVVQGGAGAGLAGRVGDGERPWGEPGLGGQVEGNGHDQGGDQAGGQGAHDRRVRAPAAVATVKASTAVATGTRLPRSSTARLLICSWSKRSHHQVSSHAATAATAISTPPARASRAASQRLRVTLWVQARRWVPLLELAGQQRTAEQEPEGDRQQGAEQRDRFKQRAVAAGEGLDQDLAVAAGGDAGSQAGVAGERGDLPAAGHKDQTGHGQQGDGGDRGRPLLTPGDRRSAASRPR